MCGKQNYLVYVEKGSRVNLAGVEFIWGKPLGELGGIAFHPTVKDKLTALPGQENTRRLAIFRHA